MHTPGPWQDAPHFDWRTVMGAKDDTPAEFLTALDRYFTQFCEERETCPGCGEKLFADAKNLVGQMLATFEWGLAHGHEACRKCSWPATVHHFVKDNKGEELCSLRNFPLIVHPEFVSKREA